MAKAWADLTLCKGCRLCVDNCPKAAIIPLERINKKGYPVIRIDTEKCVGCGGCYRVCPDCVFTIQ